MSWLVSHWTRVVLIGLPLLLIGFDAAILFAEWRQSDAEKAVRLVRESKSRKENFTVQQYLYATVYHRQNQGEAITIEGWRVEPDIDSLPLAFLVSFTWADADGQHIATWQANLQEKKVVSKDKEADELSWH